MIWLQTRKTNWFVLNKTTVNKKLLWHSRRGGPEWLFVLAWYFGSGKSAFDFQLGNSSKNFLDGHSRTGGPEWLFVLAWCFGSWKSAKVSVWFSIRKLQVCTDSLILLRTNQWREDWAKRRKPRDEKLTDFQKMPNAFAHPGQRRWSLLHSRLNLASCTYKKINICTVYSAILGQIEI